MRKKIGALWKYEKDGEVWFSGNVDFPVPITIDENTRISLAINKSDHDKSPYFDFYIDKMQPKRVSPNAGKSDFDSDTPF